jgi:hypothetical protein
MVQASTLQTTKGLHLFLPNRRRSLNHKVLMCLCDGLIHLFIVIASCFIADCCGMSCQGGADGLTYHKTRRRNGVAATIS